jgi:hypothetical protein
MKGVFTRSRQPKMAAHLLSEFWKNSPDPQAEEEAPSPNVPAMIEEKNHTQEKYGSEADIGAVMGSFAQRLDGKHQGLSATLKFDFHSEGIFRVIFENGRCQVAPGDGEAAVTVKLKWRDARKLLSGKLNPIAAVMTGKIKTSGDIRAFMFLKDLIEGD